jgi:hypothetical protein
MTIKAALRDREMNRLSKAFIAGFVGGVVAPFSALSAEPARRVNIKLVDRSPDAVAKSWRAVGRHLRGAISEHERATKSKAA